MNTIPQTASMHELKNNSNAVFKKAENGPVLLLSRATPKAVIVSPTAWDEAARRMEELEFEIAALRVRLDRNEDNWHSLDDMKAGMQKRGLIDDKT